MLDSPSKPSLSSPSVPPTGQTALRSYLEMLGAQFQLALPKLLLAQGLWLEGKPLPKGTPRGMPKSCYANAGRLALENPELSYCEGYAAGIIPVHHAWCLTPAGEVVDNTWDDAEACHYVGLVFEKDFLHQHWHQTESWAVWAEMPTPALKGRQLRECLSRRWHPSDSGIMELSEQLERHWRVRAP